MNSTEQEAAVLEYSVPSLFSLMDGRMIFMFMSFSSTSMLLNMCLPYFSSNCARKGLFSIAVVDFFIRGMSFGKAVL